MIVTAKDKGCVEIWKYGKEVFLSVEDQRALIAWLAEHRMNLIRDVVCSGCSE